jgi:23S rRNA (pseudouridine1915-N3)-methyltransferase
LICVGRLKAGAERDLSDRYLERTRAAGRALGLTLDVKELDEAAGRRAADRKAGEAALIEKLVAGGRLVAFDETGRALDSLGFAALLRAGLDDGLSSLSFVIGGPDGLDEAIRARASDVIAFGAMTWPHQLVRIMASEQIYRAVTILLGHPYHRV